MTVTRAEFGELAKTYRLVPVTRTLFADGETPVGVYRKLAEAPGHEWRDRFRLSDEYRRYIEEPLVSDPLSVVMRAQHPLASHRSMEGFDLTKL